MGPVSEGWSATALAVVLFVGTLAGTPGVATAQTSTITDFSYAGDGSVETGWDVLYIWQSSSHSFEVALDNGGSARTIDVCVGIVSQGAPITCVQKQLPADSAVTASVTVQAWPSNATGGQTAYVSVSDAGAGNELDRATLPLTVLRMDGDLDTDGISNSDEVNAGTRVDLADTDGDGLLDGEEVNTFGTDPTKADTDGDGLRDPAELNDTQTDPTVADTDGDGLTDDLEVRKYGTNPNNPDTDRDSLDDRTEVNSHQTNPLKADSDADGLGDAAEVNEYGTDPNSEDTDGDGIADGEEANIYGTDATKADTDGDELTDYAEINHHQTDPASADSDEDGLSDGPELNVYDTNPNKADTDGDGLDDGMEVNRGSDPTVANENARVGVLWTLRQWGVPAVGVAVGGVVLAAGAAVVILRRELVTDAVRQLASGFPAPRDDAGPADEVLSKEDRILKILDENGDRIRQSEIVERTGWSKSTVSRTLSRMEAGGDITKIDVGRGNVIARAGEEPENSGSPYDS